MKTHHWHSLKSTTFDWPGPTWEQILLILKFLEQIFLSGIFLKFFCLSKYKLDFITIFYRFFTLYPDYQRQFKSFKDVPVAFGELPLNELRINKKLIAHGTFVMYTLGMLVDHLEDSITLEVMLRRLARNHYRRRVNLTAFELLRETFILHLVDRLGLEIVGQREIIAWRKAFALVLGALEREYEVLEVDVAKRGSYFQLSAAHRSARNSMLRSAYVNNAYNVSSTKNLSKSQTGSRSLVLLGLPPRSPVVSSNISITNTSTTTTSKKSLKLFKFFKPFKLVRKPSSGK